MQGRGAEGHVVEPGRRGGCHEGPHEGRVPPIGGLHEGVVARLAGVGHEAVPLPPDRGREDPLDSGPVARVGRDPVLLPHTPEFVGPVVVLDPGRRHEGGAVTEGEVAQERTMDVRWERHGNAAERCFFAPPCTKRG